MFCLGSDNLGEKIFEWWEKIARSSMKDNEKSRTLSEMFKFNFVDSRNSHNTENKLRIFRNKIENAE